MFLIVNSKHTDNSNKRLVYNITNVDNKENYIGNILDGDVVELTLTELYSNTVHKFIGSYNRFVPKVPYSFTLVDSIAISNVSNLKSAVDFKLVESRVVKYADPNRPNHRHFIVVEGENGKELEETYVFRPDRVSDDTNLKREVIYKTKDGRNVVIREDVDLARKAGIQNDILSAPEYDILDDLDYILPAGGAVVPIISTEQLLTKSYLRKKLNDLVTINRLEDNFKDVVKKQIDCFESMLVNKTNELLEKRLKSLVDKDELLRVLAAIERAVIQRVKDKTLNTDDDNASAEVTDTTDVPFDRTPSGNDCEGLLPLKYLRHMLDTKSTCGCTCNHRDPHLVPFGKFDHRLFRHGRPDLMCHPHLDKNSVDWGDLVAGGNKTTTIPDKTEVIVKPSEPTVDNKETETNNGVTTPDPTPPTEVKEFEVEVKEPEQVTPSKPVEITKPDETPNPAEQTKPAEESKLDETVQGVQEPKDTELTVPSEKPVETTSETKEPEAPANPDVTPQAVPTSNVVYWGSITSENPTEGDILALQNTTLEALSGFEFDPGSEEDEGYCVLAYPTSFGKSPRFINRGNGFTQTPLYVQTLQVNGVEYRLEIFEYSYDPMPLRLS